MKTGRNVYWAIIISLVATVALFLSCNNNADLTVDEAPSVADVTASYKKAINLQLSFAQKGIAAVEKYVDIPSALSRGIRSGVADFSEIGGLLPDDLSMLKRSASGASRGDDIREITLEEELHTLVEDFTRALEAVLPDPQKALSLPYITEAEYGLRIGDDLVIPYNSIEGVLTVEVLNAVADGADMAEVMDAVAAELSVFLVSKTTNPEVST